MQGTPHDVENVPPDSDKHDTHEEDDPRDESAGSPETPTGPRPADAEEGPGDERDPDQESPAPDSEKPPT
jgi:hypothetical protein